MGSLAPLFYSVVALFIAMTLPCQTSVTTVESNSSSGHWYLLNPQNLWIVSHGLFAVSMLGTFIVESAMGTVLLFSIVGFSWAITSRVPYSLLGDELSRSRIYTDDEEEDYLADRQGLIYGIHNFAVCVPQVIIMLVMVFFWIFTEEVHGNHGEGRDRDVEEFLGVVWFLRLGGLSALVAMYFAIKLRQCASDTHQIGYVDYVQIPLEEREPIPFSDELVA